MSRYYNPRGTVRKLEMTGILPLNLLILLSGVCSAAATCSSTTSLLYITPSDPPVTLTSPNYPMNYPANIYCWWEISSPSTDYRVQLTLNNLQLGNCPDDYLSIYEGSDLSEIVRLCGDVNPISITSRGQSLFVEFSTDDVVHRQGFSITYSAFEVNIACPPTWTQYGTNCYKIRTDSQSWDTAQMYCGYDASNLIVITSAGENEMIKSHLPDTLSYWIGLLRDSSNEQKWVDGSDVSYTNALDLLFDYSQTEEACFSINAGSTYWYNVGCSTTYYPYICEKDIYGTTSVQLPLTIAKKDDSFEGWKVALIVVGSIIFLVFAKSCYDKHCRGKCCTDTSSVSPTQPPITASETSTGTDSRSTNIWKDNWVTDEVSERSNRTSYMRGKHPSGSIDSDVSSICARKEFSNVIFSANRLNTPVIDGRLVTDISPRFNSDPDLGNGRSVRDDCIDSDISSITSCQDFSSVVFSNDPSKNKMTDTRKSVMPISNNGNGHRKHQEQGDPFFISRGTGHRLSESDMAEDSSIEEVFTDIVKPREQPYGNGIGSQWTCNPPRSPTSTVTEEQQSVVSTEYLRDESGFTPSDQYCLPGGDTPLAPPPSYNEFYQD